MFVGRSEISISVIFKHNQNIGIARTFCPWGGGVIKLWFARGEISTQADTINKWYKTLKSSFKQTIGININQNYQRKLNIIIHPSFERVNRLFLLSFENETSIRGHTEYYLETKDYDGMIDGWNCFDLYMKTLGKLLLVKEMFT